ncbi:MAG TPA: hypothetical protein VNC22_01870 [Sporichthya sp.]|nr:hypothetical protein [Sporichthya sp.]
MQYFIQSIRRPAAAYPVRRALAGILAAFVGAAGCDRQPDTLPTRPAIANRAVPHAALVGATVTILPTLGGSATFAAAINDAGQVVGWSNTPEGRSHAFLWTADGGMHDLGTLGGFHSFATDINSAGQVTGYADLTGSQTWHAFLWTPGEGMQDLGTLDGGVYSYGRAMNDVGQILGTSASATGGSTMFLWSPDRGMQDLPSLGVPGQSIDLNNAGQIVGAADFGGERHPFLWTPGAGTRDLGSLGGEPTVALAVNESAWVVGRTNSGPPSTRAFLWTPRDGMRDLGTLGAVGRSNVANDVNDLGQVVGESYTAAFKRHGFVWSETDGMEDIFPATGMTSATAINNRGQVIFADRVATLQFRPPVINPHGAFITGGGFYDVPGQDDAKAHFAFNARLLPGEVVPNGSTKVWIPGAAIDFESSAIETLVVSGNRAQFWGTGTANGAAARFRITAVDDSEGGDAIRVEIWNATGTALVYDSQPGAAQDAAPTTMLEGGDIQIH